jgi:predicted ATPase
MLTKIGLTNFKCFQQVTVGCTSLNLLCGLNGMGKSSVIQAMLVLRQSFETGELANGRLVLGGRHADLGMGSDVLFEDADRDELGFTLESRQTEKNWGLYFAYSRESDLLSVVQASSGNQEPYVPTDWQDIPPFGGDFVYVNAERVGPRKFYPLSDVLARRGDLGPRGEHTWNFLSHHKQKTLAADDPRLGASGRRQLLSVVDDWLQEVSPGAHLELETITAADALIAGFTFDRPGDVASRRHRATNVGFGLSYVLPVVVALLSEAGTLCLIENPESHLHPRGQTKLAELAARSSKAGVQVFVETHSDHFMDGVRIAVRDGIIQAEDATFHFFEREGTRSVITSPEIDSDGRLSRWPTGFFDQHEMNLVRLLRPISPDA